MKEFVINEFLSLRFIKNRTIIYVANQAFMNCKYLLFNIELDNIEQYNTYDTIDEAIEFYNRDHERNKQLLDPQTEFWGHCSNLQAWVENDYDTRLLDMNLSFPLLKKLSDVGDKIARRVFKEEIAKRFQHGNFQIKEFLLAENYFSYFTTEELEATFTDNTFADILTLEETQIFSILNHLIKLGIKNAKSILKKEFNRRLIQKDLIEITDVFNKGYIDNLENEDQIEILTSFFKKRNFSKESKNLLFSLMHIKDPHIDVNNIYIKLQTIWSRFSKNEVWELHIFFDEYLERVVYNIVKRSVSKEMVRRAFLKEVKKIIGGRKEANLLMDFLEFFIIHTTQKEIKALFQKDLPQFIQIFYEVAINRLFSGYSDENQWIKPGKIISPLIKQKLCEFVQKKNIEEVLNLYEVSLIDCLTTQDLISVFDYTEINILPFLLEKIKGLTKAEFKYHDFHNGFFLENITDEVSKYIGESIIHLFPDYSLKKHNEPLFCLGFFDDLTQDQLQRVIKNMDIEVTALFMSQLHAYRDIKSGIRAIKRTLEKLDIKINEFHSIGINCVQYKGEFIPVLYNILDLSDKNIDDLNEVQGLFELKELNALILTKNKINYLPEAISIFTSLKALYLDYNELSMLPESIGKLTSLELLNISYNPLKTLPDSIVNLQSLEYFYAQLTHLNTFPKMLTKLTSLKELSLLDNNILMLPEDIGNLGSLREFWFNWEFLTQFPESLKNLKSLQFIRVQYNFTWTTIPEIFTQLPSLRELSFFRSSLKTIPESIGNLTTLKELNLFDNQLEALPESIGNLKSLERLILSFNNITTLPGALLDLPNIKYINLKYNPLEPSTEPLLNILRKKGVYISMD